MNVVQARPPNFDKIAAAFPVATRRRGVIYAYGDTIYNPDGIAITPALAAHEKEHSRRQRSLFPFEGAEGWWNHYIANPQFRLGEEIVAHRAEYRKICEQPDIDKPVMGFRSARLFWLAQIASRLASPLYGSLITTAKAKEIIGAEPPNSRHPDNPPPAAPA